MGAHMGEDRMSCNVDPSPVHGQAQIPDLQMSSEKCCLASHSFKEGPEIHSARTEATKLTASGCPGFLF